MDFSSARANISSTGRSRSLRAGNAEEMARPGHERWLVSYADFMTLLMAFFVVMYSTAQVSDVGYEKLSETLMDAFDDKRAPAKEAAIEQAELPPFSVDQVIVSEGEIQRSHSDVLIDLEGNAIDNSEGNDENTLPTELVAKAEEAESEIFNADGEVEEEIAGDERWVEITLPSSVLFKSGDAKLSEEANTHLASISEELAKHEKIIRVEGFTDNVPIIGSKYDSNWELSAARAAAVVKYFAQEGIEPARLSAAGYGEHQPVADNRTAQGREENRRIVIMVSTKEVARQDAADFAYDAQSDYQKRPPLEDGQLVYGPAVDAMEEAKAIINRRFRRAADTVVPAGELDSPAAPLEGSVEPELSTDLRQARGPNGELLIVNQ